MVWSAPLRTNDHMVGNHLPSAPLPPAYRQTEHSVYRSLVLLICTLLAACGDGGTTAPSENNKTLTGQVMEGAFPPPGVAFPIPGVTVKILEGSGAGKTVSTDTSGSFSFTELAEGVALVSFEKSGYNEGTFPLAVPGSGGFIFMTRVSPPSK